MASTPTEVMTVAKTQSPELQRFMPVMTMDLAIERRETIVTAFQKLMKDGQDYGRAPGIGKPTLLQPGAQKLDNLFGLVPRFIIEERTEDWTGESYGGEPFFRYLIKCQVWRGEFIMGEAIGECNSWESKYRYRVAERTCPTCGAGAIIKTKKKTWWCAKFKGGCNAGFPENDPKILGQETGRKANPEIFDQVNTLLKMAQKRAHVAATINATSASEFFTQDVEDLKREAEEIDTGGHPVGTQAAADYVAEQQIKNTAKVDPRPIPEELELAFARIDKDPKAAIGESFKLLEDALIAEAADGKTVYDRNVLALRARYPKGAMLPIEAIKSCLLDLWDDLTIIRDSKATVAQ